MPPRAQAKVFQVLIKTHKLTVLTTVVPTITVAALKDDVLSALSSDVNTVEGVPPITSADDFELCKGVKAQGKLTGEFQPLNDLTQSIKEAGVTNYEALFVQFRDPDSPGNVLPVVFVPFEDDEDEVSPQFSAPAPPVESSTSRGKRKARPE